MLLDPTVRAFDLILFAEILEHLRNPGLALDNLRQLCATHHCKLCVTVPNALSVVAFTNALRGIESVHPDHCAYYSPHTLRKVLLDSGFTDVRARTLLIARHPPFARPHEARRDCRGLGRLAARRLTGRSAPQKPFR